MLSGDPRLSQRLAELLQLECSSRVLDVCCGDGGSAVELAWRLGCRVVGIDPSPENVEVAARRARERGVDSLCTFLQSDPERIQLGDRFDAVILELDLGARPDPDAAARELARLVRPGGRLALVDRTPAGHASDEGMAAAVRAAGFAPGTIETDGDREILLATRS
jgi:ubiquinone/menaquinone biosynthesis C-methylase UbiE